MSGYLPKLDGLRAIAVLSVISWHSMEQSAFALPFGPMGVWLFFSLSGYLITGILLKAKASDASFRENLWVFYTRRSLRIFPAYYLTLVVTALTLPEVRAAVWWHAFYLSNFYFAIQEKWTMGGHFWSLAVEEQFYLLWPAIVLITPRRWLLPTFLALVAVSPVYRKLVYVNNGAWWSSLMLPSNLDCLCCGAILATLSARSGKVFAMACGFCGTALFCYLGMTYSEESKVIYLPLITAFLSTFLIWLCVTSHSPVLLFLEWRPLVGLGKISYGVYLYHNFIVPEVVVIEKAADIWLRFPDLGFLQFIVVTIVTIALATASWFLFEKPILSFKKYFEYARQ